MAYLFSRLPVGSAKISQFRGTDGNTLSLGNINGTLHSADSLVSGIQQFLGIVGLENEFNPNNVIRVVNESVISGEEPTPPGEKEDPTMSIGNMSKFNDERYYADVSYNGDSSNLFVNSSNASVGAKINDDSKRLWIIKDSAVVGSGSSTITVYAPETDNYNAASVSTIFMYS